jgi:acetolactate synthase small subunit
MTITVLGDEKVITQVQRQLEDLIPVVVVERLDKGLDHAVSYVERDFMIIKVSTPKRADRSEILELTSLFDGKVRHAGRCRHRP